MKRLLLLCLVCFACEDPVVNPCVHDGVCCPDGASSGVTCGTVAQSCKLDPVGSCTCTQDHVWACFGLGDLAVRVRDLTVRDLSARDLTERDLSAGDFSTSD